MEEIAKSDAAQQPEQQTQQQQKQQSAAPDPPVPVAIAAGRVVGTPTEVYTRVARGVLSCWFGADGPLKANYIYHAQADPASKGGNSRIRIMTRDHEADDPRALRAYMLTISPGDGITKVEAENRRLPEHFADALQQDIERWATGQEECGTMPVAAAEPGPAAEKKQTNIKKNKEKNKNGGER